jgi:serine/threonine protein kinase
MADNRAPRLAFPQPQILEAQRDFILNLTDGRQMYGYVRCRYDGSVAYTIVRKGPSMASGKGRIYYGYAFIRNQEGTYEIDGKNPVVVKKLNKNWIIRHTHENVLNEIFVAQAVGDDVHIARIREALEDEKYIYIIMPLLGRDLIDTRKYVRLCYPTITNRLIQNLLHLRKLGILHCDISAENIIAYPDDSDRVECPLIDFAMAIQCATDENGRYLRVVRENPLKIFGKLRYMSPEVVYGKDLCFGVDIWAIGCLLFFLWTGTFLYDSPGDACWEYFVMGRETLPRHPRVTEILDLWEHQLTDVQRDLFLRIMQPQWEERATPEEILEHSYLQNQN